MKYFLSQPMNGLTEEQIIDNTDKYVKTIKSIDPRMEYVNTLFFPKESDFPNGVTGDKRRIFCLGRSVSRIAECDCIVFVTDCYIHSNGCKIEYEVAKTYGIPMYTLIDERLYDLEPIKY